MWKEKKTHSSVVVVVMEAAIERWKWRFLHITYTYALLKSQSIFKCVEGLVSVVWSLTLGTHFSSSSSFFDFIFV